MKSKMKKTLGAGLMSFGLVFGLSGITGAQMGLIDTSGPGSRNTIKERTTSEVKVRNNNNLGVANHNAQNAHSGEAEARFNTTAGDARTGNASNANSTSVSATVNNTGAGTAAVAAAAPAVAGNDSASIERTGPDSRNNVEITKKSEVTVTNTNNVTFTNTNTQTATSGDAEVKRNTTGGSAVSGNASNTNSTSVTFNISN